MRRSPRATALVLAAIVATSTLAATTPASAADLLNDGFETGTLASWSTTQNFTAQQAIVRSGSWAGRATASAQPAYAQADLDSPIADVYVRSFIHVVSHSASMPVLRALNPTGGLLATLNVSAANELVLNNKVSGASKRSGVIVPAGTFFELQLRLFISGASGTAEVWYNGARIDALSGTQNFGTANVASVLIGRDDTTSSSMDAVFDDVVISTTFVTGGPPPPPPTDPPATPTGLRTTSVSASQVGLAWDAVSGATSYTVYRDGGFLADTTVPTHTDPTVDPDTTYSYTVTANNVVGPSAPTAPLIVVTPATPPPTDETVVMAAGDIACDPADTNFRSGNGTSSKCRQKYTAALLSGADHVLTLGDQQYECGGLTAFQQSYDKSWGAYKSITHPILADEEYASSGTGCGASGPDGYLSYFQSQLAPNQSSALDPTRGYYSFDIGSWHVVALNSECSKITGGCGEGSPQNNWLESDLATSTASCTLAMLHEPRFRSKRNKPDVSAAMLPFWEDLYAAGAEMVLGGDSHFYERFAPQNPQGSARSDGVVQFVVGTGGKSHGGIDSAGSRHPNSVAGIGSTFGVLKLTLRDGGYDWRFLVEGGSSFSDAGTASCH